MKHIILAAIILCLSAVASTAYTFSEVIEEDEESRTYHIEGTVPPQYIDWKCKTCCEGEVYMEMWGYSNWDGDNRILMVSRNLNTDCSGNDSDSGSTPMVFGRDYVQLFVYHDDCSAADKPKAAFWHDTTEPTFASCGCSEP